MFPITHEYERDWQLHVEGTNLYLEHKGEKYSDYLILDNVGDLESLWLFERHLEHRANNFALVVCYLSKLKGDDHREIEMLFMKLTPETFKNYFIPIPIEGVYFSLETMELVNLTYVQLDNDEYYPKTGEVVQFKLLENGNYTIADNDTPDLWYKNDGERWRWMDERIRKYFTVDKFLDILKDLYSKLLADKTYATTVNQYMFMQRMSYLSNYQFID